MALALERMEVQDGYIDWTYGVPRLVFEGAADGGTGGIPLTGNCWLLGKKHEFDPSTDATYIVGYANTNSISLEDVMPNDMPPNSYVRILANEQGDIYMGC